MNKESLPICLDKKSGGDFFDEIIVGRFTRISFHRTLRIPEDGRDYPLPAGLGRFPIHRVQDFADKVPVEWLQEGGFFLPLYQKEALFLQFDGPTWHPTIAKVCVGRINAVSGKPYSDSISKAHQDYVVIPKQRWLDGICSGDDLVRQFVAMPLGQGYTIEAQISDEEKFGGFQIAVINARDGRFPDRNPKIDSRIEGEEKRRRASVLCAAPLAESIRLYSSPARSMGIAAGGSIKQQIQKDTYGVQSWDSETTRSLTIHLVNSLSYKEITGMDPPPSPITVEAYQRYKIPWYSHYDETAPVIKPPSIFKRILGISAIDRKRGILQPDDPFQRSIAIQKIRKIATPTKSEASGAFRELAHESRSKGLWEAAVREISYVIDLQFNVRAEDYALRSCCNFHLGRFKDGSIDASLALEEDKQCIEAISWRAYCRKSLGDHEGLLEDADALTKMPGSELVGLELKAEAALLAKRYPDAFNDAMALLAMSPGHLRANQIITEVNINVFGYDIEETHDI